MPKAVIFDVDGTLIDSVDLHARAWQDALREWGREIEFEDAGETLGERRGDILKERYLSQVTAFPGARELLERVRADGKRVVLASSAKADELEAHKELAGIGDLVDVETTSDDAEQSKPHPDIFLAALRRLDGMAPGDVVVVGDTPYDAEAAGKAGLRAVGLLCGGFPEGDLRDAGCIAIYRDPADLLARYNQSPLAGGEASF